jgi:hypothetical protein
MIRTDWLNTMKPAALVALGSLALLTAAGELHALGSTPPALLGLTYVENGQRQGFPIEVTPGTFVSPQAGQPKDRWTIIPGQALPAETKPLDRVVELYRGAGTARVLLSVVQVRYFRNNVGLWVPHFLLVEQPLLRRDGDRWQPLTALAGAPGFMVLTGSALPNAEGFYPTLEFGLSNGRLQIDTWVVR